MKTRNNSLRIKRSIEKTAKKLNHVEKMIREDREKQRTALLKKEKKKATEQKQKMMLASLDKMSYNEVRKLAASLDISIYQRRKAEIIKDLKQHYEQLTTTH
jgi:ERCC4-type nuclease